jgi:hypothetical protein
MRDEYQQALYEILALREAVLAEQRSCLAKWKPHLRSKEFKDSAATWQPTSVCVVTMCVACKLAWHCSGYRPAEVILDSSGAPGCSTCRDSMGLPVPARISVDANWL